MKILSLIIITFSFLLLTSCTSEEIKGRDSIRLSDIGAMRDEIEDYYMKNGKYPDSFNSTRKDPLDGKDTEVSTQCTHGYKYKYEVKNSGQCFLISACMERGYKNTASKDGGIYNDRYEKGVIGCFK